MTLRRALRKLRLKDGDVLLVHRSLAVLVHNRGLMAPAGVASIPIVFIENKNDIRRLSFEELEKLYLEAKKAKDGTQTEK